MASRFTMGSCFRSCLNYLRHLLIHPVFWLAVVQTIMFVVEISLHGFASPKDNPSLGPPTISLIQTGGKYGYGIQKEVIFSFPYYYLFIYLLFWFRILIDFAEASVQAYHTNFCPCRNYSSFG